MRGRGGVEEGAYAGVVGEDLRATLACVTQVARLPILDCGGVVHDDVRRPRRDRRCHLTAEALHLALETGSACRLASEDETLSQERRKRVLRGCSRLSLRRSRNVERGEEGSGADRALEAELQRVRPCRVVTRVFLERAASLAEGAKESSWMVEPRDAARLQRECYLGPSGAEL